MVKWLNQLVQVTLSYLQMRSNLRQLLKSYIDIVLFAFVTWSVFYVSSVCIIIVSEHFHGQRKKISETTLKVKKNIFIILQWLGVTFNSWTVVLCIRQ